MLIVGEGNERFVGFNDGILTGFGCCVSFEDVVSCVSVEVESGLTASFAGTGNMDFVAGTSDNDFDLGFNAPKGGRDSSVGIVVVVGIVGAGGKSVDGFSGLGSSTDFTPKGLRTLGFDSCSG